MQFVYCYCLKCKRMFAGPKAPLLLHVDDYDLRSTPPSSTKKWIIESCGCSSPAYTPPIVVFVPPFHHATEAARPASSSRKSEYDDELERAMDESFQEEVRDREPGPAAERTLGAIAAKMRVLEADATCSICLERMLAGQTAFVFGCCKARAHAECVDKSLIESPCCCPLCKWSPDM